METERPIYHFDRSNLRHLSRNTPLKDILITDVSITMNEAFKASIITLSDNGKMAILKDRRDFYGRIPRDSDGLISTGFKWVRMNGEKGLWSGDSLFPDGGQVHYHYDGEVQAICGFAFCRSTHHAQDREFRCLICKGILNKVESLGNYSDGSSPQGHKAAE